MIRQTLQWFFRALGWRIDSEVPESAFEKCVIIAAPHTYLPDMVLAYAGLSMLGVNIRICVADKYARWPIKSLLESMGAIWIDRSRTRARASYIETMVELFTEQENLCIVVAPEGARALRTQWKTGFYHVAHQAGIPICFGYLDYERKIAGIGGELVPTGNVAADLETVMAFYTRVPAKHPEKFSVDLRYHR